MAQQAINVAHWGAFRPEVAGGRLVAAHPLPGDPTPSPMLATIPAMLHHATRITQPMVRESYLRRRTGSDRRMRGGEPFVPVSWPTALNLVGDELARVRAEHGPSAIYAGSGWGSPGRLHNSVGLLTRFLAAGGGYAEAVTNFSFGAAMILVPRIVGTGDPIGAGVTTWPVILQHTRLFVCFGGLPAKNGQISPGGLARHQLPQTLQAMEAAGIETVCLSPVQDDAPGTAAWIPLRPGSDLAVMMGMAHTLLSEGLADHAFLERYTVGFEQFRPYLLGDTDGTPKDADWAAALSAVPAAQIRSLARRMAATRSMLSVSWSVQRAERGEQPFWMAIVLAAMLGQIGLPGGGFGFGYGAMGTIGMPRLPVAIPKMPTIPNMSGCIVPCARATDMLLSPGAEYDFNGRRLTYPDVRLMYWSGGNPFHHSSDLNRLLQAWQKPETIIVHEPWWTPAARRADIVLPAATFLERNDIAAAAYDDTWFAMKQAVAPVGQSRRDYDIFSDLADVLGYGARFTEGRDEMGWLRAIYDTAQQAAAKLGADLPDFDGFWEAGEVRLPARQQRVLFDTFRADPDTHRLATPSGLIEIASSTIGGFGYADTAAYPTWQAPSEWAGAADLGNRLDLVSNQPRHRLHSQMDPGPVSGSAKVAGREPARLNPADAADRGIRDGDVVRLFNDRGACLAGAVVTDRIMRGVVELATGAWFDPESSVCRHGNPNVLTRDQGTSSLAQGCAAQTALVHVERYVGAAPPVAVLQPPPICLPVSGEA